MMSDKPVITIVSQKDPSQVFFGMAKATDKFVIIAQKQSVSFDLNTPDDYLVEYICWRCRGVDKDIPLMVKSNFGMGIPDFVYEGENICDIDLKNMIKFVRYCYAFDMHKEST